ncbi:MAG: di-trans,poly-cis-decaprenylcistransferase [Thaumarchaeota archaeon]|nr:di-trans,poly-cis-decaprenylcistransferase [Nitrososphaerota archaeon]
MEKAKPFLSYFYKLYSQRLENEIRRGTIPNHIAVILDGNRRWAKKALTMSNEGHFKGADAVENFLDWCEELDIKIITLYVLSTENLDRKDNELEYLYELIRQRLEKLYVDPRIHKNKMRVKAMGRTELLSDPINDVLKRLDDATREYDNHYLNIAIAYGGQNELVDAIKKIAAQIKNGSISVNDINKDVIEANLYTAHLPQQSPDLILRTSGEQRMSGFLLWQGAYSELIFMDILWPEFRKIDLLRAIRTFQKRNRRIGK